MRRWSVTGEQQRSMRNGLSFLRFRFSTIGSWAIVCRTSFIRYGRVLFVCVSKSANANVVSIERFQQKRQFWLVLPSILSQSRCVFPQKRGLGFCGVVRLAVRIGESVLVEFWCDMIVCVCVCAGFPSIGAVVVRHTLHFWALSHQTRCDGLAIHRL